MSSFSVAPSFSPADILSIQQAMRAAPNNLVLAMQQQLGIGRDHETVDLQDAVEQTMNAVSQRRPDVDSFMVGTLGFDPIITTGLVLRFQGESGLPSHLISGLGSMDRAPTQFDFRALIVGGACLQEANPHSSHQQHLRWSTPERGLLYMITSQTDGPFKSPIYRPVLREVTDEIPSLRASDPIMTVESRNGIWRTLARFFGIKV